MKRRMRLDARCLEILTHLSFGPATATDILLEFFRDKNVDLKKMRQTMKVGMRKLERKGLIRSAFSARYGETLYVLRIKAVPIVAAQLEIDIDNTWVMFDFGVRTRTLSLSQQRDLIGEPHLRIDEFKE